MPPGIRLLLVDALNLIRRVYAAQPGEDGAERAREGLESSLRSLGRALSECEPTHAVAVFDGAGETWRHRLFGGYKADRKPMPEALADSLPRYVEAFAELGVQSFERPATEADDVIATLATKVDAVGGSAVILATDKGYLQLMSERIAVRDHFKHLNVGPGLVRERFGVGPERLVDLIALAGDPTSSIGGVPGVGQKTAAKLLADWGSLAAALEAADRSVAGQLPVAGPQLSPKLAQGLAAHAEDARLAWRLSGLVTDLELGINLQDFRYRSREPPSSSPDLQ